MIEKIGAVLTIIFGIFSFGYFKGKQNERNRNNNKALKKIEATKRRRKKRANSSLADDLDWVLEHKDN